jgi:hypothetical protein
MKGKEDGPAGPSYVLPEEPDRTESRSDVHAEEAKPADEAQEARASQAPAPPGVARVRIGDRVHATGGMHEGRQGPVVHILPASLEYARVRLPEGERTIPIRWLERLEPEGEPSSDEPE